MQSQCIDCQRKYRKQHYEENRKKYIDKSSDWQKSFQKWWKDYKSQFSCSECGESHPACIQFHHPNDNKEASVSRFVTNGSRQKVLKEIDKCIPLCGNCHAKLHWISA